MRFTVHIQFNQYNIFTFAKKISRKEIAYLHDVYAKADGRVRFDLFNAEIQQYTNELPIYLL